MLVEDQIKIHSPSFFGWLGGKSKLCPTILWCFPPHVCYVEIFAGSAVVFFGKNPNTSKIEAINDVNSNLVNMLKVVSGTYFDETIRNEFISYVRNMPSSREAFEDWKQLLPDKKLPDRIKDLPPAQRAYIYYYCVKNGFSCVPKGGFEASPKSVKRYNMNSDFEFISARFREKNAYIENMDFRDLIDKYKNKDVKVLFFGDPPYFVANDTNYYEHCFTEKDHLDFKNKCDEIHACGNKFLLTYDDCEEVLSLYKDYHIYRTDPITYTSMIMKDKSENIKPELFISNYAIEDVIKNKINKDKFEDSETDVFDNKITFKHHIGLTKIQ